MDDLTSQQIQQTQSASVSPPSGFQEVPMTGCSTQALTNGGSKNVGIRNRRKAPPRKVVIHERTETEPTDQDADTQSDELFEAGDIFGGQASPDDPEMAAEEPLPSGSRVTMEGSGGPSVEDLQRLSEALTGKMDVQSLLSHMIAANNSTSQQLALTSFPNAADLLQQVSNQSDLSQQMISAVAQQQLAALAAVAPFNPSTPDCSASPSLTGMHSLSSQQPSSSEQQSSSSGSSKLGQGSVRSSKRKLFETAGTQGEPMSNDERIEIEDLEQFAATFKKQRIKFGFTQGDVGQALGRRYGTDFSQTTISRFEAMNLSFKNMCKLRPLLKEWLSDAERALANGASITELIESGAQVRVENSPFPGYSFPVSKKSSPPTFPSLSSYFLKPRARSRPLSSLQGSHFLSSRPHPLHKGPLLVTTGLLPSYSKAPLSRSSISNAQSPSLSSVELSWSTDGEDVLPGKGLYRPPSLLSSHQKDLHKSQNAEGTLPPSLVQTLCASSPSHVNGIPLPTRFRRSPLTFDLHLERDVQLRKRNRRNPLKKLLKAFQFFHPKCQALVHLHEDTVRELVVCANEMVPEEQSICEKTVPELCRDMDVGNEDRIPGNLRRLENVTVEDYDPDANEWSNHTWNGTERPLLGDLGSEWKSFWNNDSWNESTFNNGLTWRGQGGFWEVPGNWMCNSEDYERPDWNTGITDALVGFDIMDQIQELVDEFGQFD